MKKKLAILAAAALFLPLVSLAIEAGNCQDYCQALSTSIPKEPPADQVCICNPFPSNTLEEVVNRIIDFLFYVAIALAPLMIIIAGFLFVTAGGNPEQITKAKKIIQWTLIGFLIVMFSKGIISLIAGVIGA